MEIGRLRSSKVVQSLKSQGVTHVIALPDSETRHMYDALVREPSIDMIPITREGEAICIAAGLWIAGKKPIVMIQNAGLFRIRRRTAGYGHRSESAARYVYRLPRIYAARRYTGYRRAVPGALPTPVASRLLRRRGRRRPRPRADGVRTGAKRGPARRNPYRHRVLTRLGISPGDRHSNR